ncbi:MAG: pyrroloquinoline quinone biosynthesis peptide chaperone PqqD [Acidobacteria bacterium]|nr:pyrroloquinoline quinone biosynthesis peptide chaperone PqqD [Acidobacteriota bacterium]MDW7983847.1 pyrroloquinoline quinone biosynthesis peptide chaperone PqqD [Acidobacteriota bacterium]
MEGRWIPVLRKGVYLRERPGAYLLLLPEGYMELDEVAWEVLHRCDGYHDVEAIAQAMAERYAGDIETIRRDIVEFLTDLRRQGLLEFREPSSEETG